MPQVIEIEGKTVHVLSTLLEQTDWNIFRISVHTKEAYPFGIDFYRQLDIPVKCMWEGKEYTAHIYRLSSCKYQVAVFDCSIKLDNHAFDEICFIIPNIAHIIGDINTRSRNNIIDGCNSIEFTVGNRHWRLSNLIETAEGYSLCEDVSSDAIKKQNKHLILHTKECAGATIETLRIEAHRISSLLVFPLGCEVRISSVYSRKNFNYIYIEGGLSPAPFSYRCFPIQQMANHTLQKYIEEAYKIFLENEDWWKLTSNWMASLYSSNGNRHTQIMIACMLMERIPSFIVEAEESNRNLIDPNIRIKEFAKKKKEELLDYFRYMFPQWKEAHNNQLWSKIAFLNSSLSYKEKVSKSFQKYNLAPPSEQLIKTRNSVMHNGSINQFSSAAAQNLAIVEAQFLVDVINCLNSIIFKMLNYNNRIEKLILHTYST